jgi:hypothetical protein
MQSTGPFTLSFGIPSTYIDPASIYGNPSVNCQIQNSSVFVLTVQTGPDQLTIQPFTAQTVVIEGLQQLIITPSQNPSGGSTSETLTLVWLLAGESPPMQDGPLTAAAILASVQTPIDLLLSTGALPGPGNPLGTVGTSNTFPALNNYTEIDVQFRVLVQPQTWAVSVQNVTQEIGSGWQIIAPNGSTTLAPGLLQFPIPAKAGDLLTISTTQTTGSITSVANEIVVVGVSQPHSQTSLRGDGRSFPQHTMFNGGFLTSTNTNIIPAPGIGLRYLLSHVGISGGTADGQQIETTVAGSIQGIVGIQGVGAWERQFPQGLLCDNNAAVVLKATTAIATFVSLTYDVVPA